MKHHQGFTLIEMAIVLIIITILIGGLAVPLSAQIQARRIAETNKTLHEAREAIFGYAMSHTAASTCPCIYHADGDGVADSTGCPVTISCPVINPPTSDTSIPMPITRHYLPCPDKPDDGDPTTTDDGDGLEQPRNNNDGSCPLTVGFLPWATLGVSNQDAWGNRLLYAVTDKFSNSSGFSWSDEGDLQVCSSSANTSDSDCGAQGNVASKVPVVILSYGSNGWGAYNINGKKLAAPSSNDEKENADTDLADKEFVSRTPSKANEFDDLVKWISADQLRGRICPAGGCP